MTYVWRLAGGLFLLSASAYFAAVLSALSSFVPLDQDQGDEGHPQHRKAAVRAVLSRPLHALASAQLGRTLSMLGFAWLVAPPLYRLFGLVLGTGALQSTVSAALALLVLTLVYVVIVQQSVRAVAGAEPSRTIHALAVPQRIWQLMSFPLTALVLWMSRPLLRLLGVDRQQTGSKADMLRRLLDENLRASELDESEQVLLSNVFDFSTRVAHEIMVPRPDVVWISTEATFDQVMLRLNDSGHTRFPLCEGGPDNVIGYLHAKDLAFVQGAYLPEQVDLRKLARRVAFVPESARAIMLLKRFQEERSHLAVVVDEFGGMAGVLTLEDLLEELVGEIRDEFDVEEPDVQALESGEFMVDGSVRLEELEDALGIGFGEAEEETVGGYIFGRLAREVNLGEELEVEGAVLRVEEVEGLRVTRVLVSPKPEPHDEDEFEEPPHPDEESAGLAGRELNVESR